MRTRTLRMLALLSLCGLMLLAAGCEIGHPRSTVTPESDFASAVHDLYMQIFWWAVGIFVVVESLLLYAVFKYRVKTESHERPEQVHGHTRLEIFWTLVPAVILVFIAVPTIRTIFAVAAPPPENALHVKVTAQQWFWHFEYPDLGIRTANEMHVPAGRTVAVELHSADIIHSFWVPRLGGKRDVVPGRTNRLFFKTDRPGDYPGQCVEFCGASHALMRFDVVVEKPEAFERWAEAQKAPASTPTGPKAREGATAFLTSGCIACHRIQGTPSQSTIGPDLTHVGSRKRIAAGILDNTPENMSRWIRDPQAVKPEAKMAKLELTEDQVEALVAYLQSLE
jgi:cytochrome c oxidase subunit 2